MSKGSEKICCINCSADLTSTSTLAGNKSGGFYSLSYSSRVRSHLRPAKVELVPVYHALATVFNFRTLEKVSKANANVSASDVNMDIGNDPKKESPFKEFRSTASAVPMCDVCYLVFSDLYRNYMEFTQLRNPDSFLGLKFEELGDQLIANRSQSERQQSQKSSFISNQNQLPNSVQDCNIYRANTLKNLEINDTPPDSKNASVNSEFIKDADLNLLPGPTELGTATFASESRPLQGKRLFRSIDSKENIAVGTVQLPLQNEIAVYESISKKTKFSFSSRDQEVSSIIKTNKKTEIHTALLKTPNSLLWKSLPCGRFKRYCHAAVAVNDTIYSFGGLGHGSWKDPIDIHALKTLDSPLQWKLLSVKTNAFTPTQRHLHTVVASGALIYLWGGFSFPQCNNQLHVFNTKTLEWEQCEVKGECPSSRWSHTATAIKNKMYVFGGSYSAAGCTSSNTIKCLDLSTLSWSTISPKNAYPAPRVNHTAVTYEDKFIFLFGGCEGEKNVHSNSLLCFNVETNEWTFPKVTGVIPEARKDHCASIHKGFMYIFGGMGNEGALNDLYRYDFERKDWQKVIPEGQSPNPRTGSESVVIKDQLIIFGGMNMIKTNDFCDDSFVVRIE